MSDINSCTFTGRLTKNAINKAVGSGLVTFDIAVNTGFGSNKKADFITVNLWGKSGMGVLPYLVKGTTIGVTGSITLNKWLGQDGLEHSQLQCNSNSIVLLSSSHNNQLAPSQPTQAEAVSTESDFGAQDADLLAGQGGLPF